MHSDRLPTNFDAASLGRWFIWIVEDVGQKPDRDVVDEHESEPLKVQLCKRRIGKRRSSAQSIPILYHAWQTSSSHITSRSAGRRLRNRYCRY
jgi:hypothetical protein